MNEPKRFTRSINDRVLAGVVGGIAHRYGWNSTLLRAIYVIVSVASAAFPVILVYVILWLLMPEGNDLTQRMPGPACRTSRCAQCSCWGCRGRCPTPSPVCCLA